MFDQGMIPEFASKRKLKVAQAAELYKITDPSMLYKDYHLRASQQNPKRLDQ